MRPGEGSIITGGDVPEIGGLLSTSPSLKEGLVVNVKLLEEEESDLIKADYKLVEVIVGNAKSLSLKSKLEEWLDENQDI